MYGERLCQHRCRNTYGGYTCICPPGTRLNQDGRTCLSKSSRFCSIFPRYSCEIITRLKCESKVLIFLRIYVDSDTYTCLADLNRSLKYENWQVLKRTLTKLKDFEKSSNILKNVHKLCRNYVEIWKNGFFSGQMFIFIKYMYLNDLRHVL